MLFSVTDLFCAIQPPSHFVSVYWLATFVPLSLPAGTPSAFSPFCSHTKLGAWLRVINTHKIMNTHMKVWPWEIKAAGWLI